MAGGDAGRVEPRASSAPALSPSDTQNQNINTQPAGASSTPLPSPAARAGRASVERTPTGSVVGVGAGRSPLVPPSTSPVGTPTRDIDTLMGGQPLTETDSEGNTRFYPVFVKSDGTQCPVSAEYLRAMGIEWPPAPVHVHQDLETLASELYQQALANSQQQQQSPANRSTHAPAGSASTVDGRGGVAASSAPAATVVRAGARAAASVAAGTRDSRGRSTSPPFSPRGAHPRTLEDAGLHESAARGDGAGTCKEGAGSDCGTTVRG